MVWMQDLAAGVGLMVFLAASYLLTGGAIGGFIFG